MNLNEKNLKLYVDVQFMKSTFSTGKKRNLKTQSQKWPGKFRWKEGDFIWLRISSVQSLSRVQLFATPWIAARQASLSITNSRSALKLMSIESVVPSSHLILCCPLLLLPQSLPASGSSPVYVYHVIKPAKCATGVQGLWADAEEFDSRAK